MKARLTLKFVCFCVLHSACCLSLSAQGTAFTYQGRLSNSGSPANGLYDFRFRLDADAQGNTILGTVLTNAIPVTNGLFTTTIDFGAGLFNGSNYWLEINVRTNAALNYTVLTPLQPLTSTPYAAFANTASNLSGALPAAQLSGTVLNSSLPASPSFSGTVSATSYIGNGANVTNVNAAMLGGVSAKAFWNLGGNNVSAGQFLGSTNNQPMEFMVNGQRAFRLEPNTNGAPNVIGGSPVNVVTPGVFGATIGGGGASYYPGDNYFNSVSTSFGTIGGGIANQILTNALYTTIGGGDFNAIQNFAYGSTIGGGSLSAIFSTDSTIGGGFNNQVQIGSSGATIGGGFNNQIEGGSGSVTIGGGQANLIQTNAGFSTISGGYGNQIQPGSSYATIAGGYQNQIRTNYATVGGGYQNTASGNFNGSGDSATVAGGYLNSALGNNAAVGGGAGNVAQGDNATVAGGTGNTNTAYNGVIGGGYFNNLSGNSGVVAGGEGNSIQDSFFSGSTIGGGYGNQIQSNAVYATIGGGENNHIQISVTSSTISGGFDNQILPNAYYATIPGGYRNSATNNAFAAGNRAKAVNTGAFVWADSQNADFVSTANNQFLIRAQGGVGIGKTNPATALDVNGTVTAIAFSGNGAALTGLSAGNLSSGLVPLAVLPGAVVTNNETGVTLNGSFSGNGASLTSLNAGSLSSGVIPSGVLSGTYSSAVTLNNAANSFSGSGAGLTSLNAANLASGTLPDARLSTNVALLSGTQNFSGAKTFSSEVAANSGVRINNTNLWFKGDNQHGLGWYGSGRPFAGSSTIDGPVLFGFSGGALATEQFGTEHLAVQWSTTSVTVNGTFNNNSDRNAKERFTVVSSAEVLAKVCQLPVAEWSYKTDATTRHLGPMAQDFFSVFNLGTDDKHIAPIDEGGVALAAIQGLNQKLEAQVRERDVRITALENELAEMKRLLKQIAAKGN